MLGLVAALCGIVAALIADVGASRCGISRPFSYGCSLAAGLVVCFGVVTTLAQEFTWAIFAIAVVAYCAWWFAFLNMVQALESSLRVKLLGQIRAMGGEMNVELLESRYSDSVLLRLRLDRLRSNGAIVERDGRLYVKSAGLKYISLLFRTLKKVLIGRTSEFEGRLG
jgi:hypothetical protein